MTDNCHVKCYCGPDITCGEAYAIPPNAHVFTPHGDDLLPCACGYRKAKK